MIHINENALPEFFKGVEIISLASEEISMLSEKNLQLKLAANEQWEVGVVGAPMLNMTKGSEKIYKSADFAQIRNMAQRFQKDLQSVYDNIAKHKEQAWTKVRKDNQEFYMCWSDTGCIWTYPESVKTIQSEDGTSFQCKIQIGTYSASNGVLGIHTFNLTTFSVVSGAILALIFALVVSDIVAAGIAIVVVNLAAYIATAAAAVGIQNITLMIPAAAVTGVAIVLVAIIAFAGLMFLWDWINRKYTVCLRIYNWDDDFAWESAGHYLENAKIVGTSFNNFTLPKALSAGGSVTPPGFNPVEVLTATCYYAELILENDNTYLQGCSVSLSMKRIDRNDGFTWAFDLPRWTDNQQKAIEFLMEPEKYYKNGNWNPNPNEFKIWTNGDKIPVKCSLNALSGAKDNLYEISINIGPPVK